MELATFCDQTWWWLLQKSCKYQEINMKVITKILEKMPKHTRGKPGAGMFLSQNLWYCLELHSVRKKLAIYFDSILMLDLNLIYNRCWNKIFIYICIYIYTYTLNTPIYLGFIWLPSHWDDSDALKDSPRKVGLGDTPDEDILKDMDSNSVSAMDIHTENQKTHSRRGIIQKVTEVGLWLHHFNPSLPIITNTQHNAAVFSNTTTMSRWFFLVKNHQKPVKNTPKTGGQPPKTGGKPKNWWKTHQKLVKNPPKTSLSRHPKVSWTSFTRRVRAPSSTASWWTACRASRGPPRWPLGLFVAVKGDGFGEVWGWKWQNFMVIYGNLGWFNGIYW